MISWRRRNKNKYGLIKFIKSYKEKKFITKQAGGKGEMFRGGSSPFPISEVSLEAFSEALTDSHSSRSFIKKP